MSRTTIIVGAVAALVVVIAGVAWSLGYFSDAPEEASITAAAEAVSDEDSDTDEDGSGSSESEGPESEGDGGTEDTADETEPSDDGGATDDEAADGEAADGGAADGGAADGISGTWTVQANEEATFVGYRINEVLTTIGDFTVVGRTPDVTGTMVADGTTVTAVDLVARMDTLSTDSSRRDSAMRSQALETSEFPEATFMLTSPIDVGEIPAEGETISVTATGDLTIHGVTQSVDFPLEAQLVGDVIVVVGQLQVQLADFGIDAPSAPVVASVEETAILELSVVFER